MGSHNYRKVKAPDNEVVIVAGHFCPQSGTANSFIPVTGSVEISGAQFLDMGKWKVNFNQKYPMLMSAQLSLQLLTGSGVSTQYRVELSGASNEHDKITSSGSLVVCLMSGAAALPANLASDSGNQMHMLFVFKNTSGK